MIREQLRDAARIPDRRARGQGGFGDGVVARGVEGDHLLDGQRLAFLDLEVQVVGDQSGLLDQERVDVDPVPVEDDPCTGRLGDEDAGLPGADLQVDVTVAGIALLHGDEVVAAQSPVAGNPRVGDRAISTTRPATSDASRS